MVGVLGAELSQRSAEQRRFTGARRRRRLGMGAAQPIVVQEASNLRVAGDQPGRIAHVGADAMNRALGLQLPQARCELHRIRLFERQLRHNDHGDLRHVTAMYKLSITKLLVYLHLDKRKALMAAVAQPVRRMRRAERREQILDAATRAFARRGFSATGLDDIAAEAGVTHVILYRHFASKSDLYRAVLDRACTRLADIVGVEEYAIGTISQLLRGAAADPEGFRLLFRHAAREPEFRDVIDTLRSTSIEVAARHLRIPDGPWRDWAARLVPTVTLEAVIAWLDAGQPDPDRAADRISYAVEAVVEAAQHNSAAVGGSENLAMG